MHGFVENRALTLPGRWRSGLFDFSFQFFSLVYSRCMNEDQGRGRLFAFALVLPFVILAPPLAGWWLGSYLDDHWQTKPWFLYAFLALGVAAGAREAFRIVKSIKDELDDR
jgi:hypothetical protein